MRLRALLLASAALVVAFSCGGSKEEPDPKPNPQPQPQQQQITVPAESQAVFNSGLSLTSGTSGEGGSAGQAQTSTVKFTATASWSADVNDTRSSSWLSVQPTSGGAGDVTMTVTAQPNTGTESRTASVSIKCGNNTKTFSVTQEGVTIIAVESVTLNKEELTLEPEASETLTATVLPENANDRTVTWTTSNAEVATVEGGKVTAIQEGKANIIAKAGEMTDTCTVTVKRAVIPVMSITLDKVSITLEENQSTLLTATVLPENATDKSVTWTTSNSEVATVSDGRVTSVSEGEADITAQAGEQTATCKVTVKKVVVAVSSISLNKTSLQIIKGQSETLIATVSPDNATDKTVSWSSDDATIASVDQEGKVMGLKGGEVTIIAKAGEVSATCNVTIIVPVASVSLNKTELFIETGNTETLTATVLPEDATDKSVVWTSSNAQIVSVEGGIVSALKAGTAAITAVSGGIAASCVVSVKDYVFEITPNQVQLQADGGSFEVKVNTTHAYEVSSKPDWVTAVSVVNQVHTYEVGENPSMESRSGVIVYCDDKGTCIPCSVTQDGKSATPSGPFSINPSSVELESSGGEFAVTVTCPTTYSITSMSDWITEKSVNGNAHSFEVGSNPSGSERSGVIVFCDDAGNCIPCNVSQKGDSSAQSGPFSISPTSIDIDASGSEFDVTVTCSTSYEISSKPDWITEKSVNGKIHTFEVGINAEANDRSGNIVFCDDQGSCIPCIVRQKKSDGSSDGINWALEFYHRSFFMKFTATWCGWCPLMEKALLKAQAEEPNKILAANFHEATSNLAFYGTAALGRTYMISSFPTGVMDAREIIRNKEEPDATDILAALYRRETKLPVVTTVGWESSISGQQLSINLDVYVKKAGSYKATVLLVENGIIGYQVVHDVGEKNDYEHNNIVRMAVSGILGDGFTAAKDNSIFKKAYSVTIPEAYIKENLMILVYVQRAYGEGVSKIDSYDYDTWFVDNCNSGKAGESLTPEVIYVDGAGGNNEGIEIGDIINF